MKYLIGIAAILFPALLLYPTGHGFAVDWRNHIWQVGYFGEYFRQHVHMPTMINTSECSGLAYPLFYGYLFYPLLGLASTWLHPEAVVRGGLVVLLFALQYVCVRKTLRRFGAAEGLAAAVACLMIWATYGLTNLYNRSAVTEFFAVGLLTCAVCSWFDLLSAPDRSAAWRRGLRFGLLLTLAAGSHPITAVCALPLLALLGVALWPRAGGVGWRTWLTPVAVAGVLGLLVLAPWVYVVHCFGNELLMCNYSREVAVFSDSIDHWSARLFPLPLDWRSLYEHPGRVSTPYLDAQINVPLLLLGVVLLVGFFTRLERRRWLGAALFLALPVGYTFVCLYFSLNSHACHRLPAVFRTAQFAYRFVSYVNLGLFLVPLFLLRYAQSGQTPLALYGSSNPTSASRVSPVWLCFILTLAGVGVVVKLLHASCCCLPMQELVTHWQKFGRVYTHAAGKPHLFKTATDRQQLTQLPLSFYGYFAYAIPNRVRRLSPLEEQQVRPVPCQIESEDGRFGDCRAMTVQSAGPGYAGTEVAPFPWNQFLVDGQPVPAEELRLWHGSDQVGAWSAILVLPRMAVPVPAGTHVVEHRFVPDPTWRRLRWFSTATLLVWVSALAAWPGLALVRRRLRTAEPNSTAAQETRRVA